MKGHSAIRGTLTLEFTPDRQVVIFIDEASLVYGAVEYDWAHDHGLDYWWAEPDPPRLIGPCDSSCGCLGQFGPGMPHVRACTCDACPITRGEAKRLIAEFPRPWRALPRRAA